MTPFRVAAVLLVTLTGCTQTLSYAGVSERTASDPYLINLAWEVYRGDRRAKLELGTLYEEGGRGLNRNPVCAARLYEAAGLGERGLPEAKARLERIRPAADAATVDPRHRCDDVAERSRLEAMTLEERKAWFKARIGN